MYVFVPLVYLVPKEDIRGHWIDPLELEFQIVVNHQVGDGNLTWVLGKSKQDY